jgi:hypothetical protein
MLCFSLHSHAKYAKIEPDTYIFPYEIEDGAILCKLPEYWNTILQANGSIARVTAGVKMLTLLMPLRFWPMCR